MPVSTKFYKGLSTVEISLGDKALTNLDVLNNLAVTLTNADLNFLLNSPLIIHHTYWPSKFGKASAIFDLTAPVVLISDQGLELRDITFVFLNAETIGRPNLMEVIVESFIADFCKERGFEYLAQARAKEMKRRWGVIVNVNKSERSFDFAIYNPINKKVKLFETNFYNGGGSKLKAVCGEFKSLYSELKLQNIDFIWVTDGLGWQEAKRPLEEMYNPSDYTFNLSMLEYKALAELIW
jgi:hypothetical protein